MTLEDIKKLCQKRKLKCNQKSQGVNAGKTEFNNHKELLFVTR